MRLFFVVAAAPFFLSTASAASLSDPPPERCEALDTYLGKGGVGTNLFNSTSEASIAAFKVGRHDDGCRLFVSVWHWTDRVMDRLDACSASSLIMGDRDKAQNFQALRSGFADLKLQFVRIDQREGCGPRS